MQVFLITFDGISERPAPLEAFKLKINLSTTLSVIWKKLNFTSPRFMKFSFFKILKVLSIKFLLSLVSANEVEDRLVKKVLNILPISSESEYSCDSYINTLGKNSSLLQDLILIEVE